MLAAPAQTVDAPLCVENAYGKLKDLARGQGGINRASLQALIATLEISGAEITTPVATVT